MSSRSLLLGVGLMSAALAGCTPNRPGALRPLSTNAAAPDSARAIGAVIDDWHDAAASSDEARYFGHLDDDSVFLGTDATERWDKAAFRAYAHPHFEKHEAWHFRSIRRVVALDAGGLLAHFDEDLWTEKLGPARGSGVVALRRGAWLILQYNLTLTIPNERFGEVHDAASAALVRADDGPLASLAWLTGVWATEGDVSDAVEIWGAPAKGSMMGMARTTTGNRPSFSSLRIEAKTSGIVLLVSLDGSAETALALTEVSQDGPKRAVFESPGGPQSGRMVYERAGDRLVARVRGIGPSSERVYQRAVLPSK